MAIIVEFYGIPRARAGVSQTRVFEDRAMASLGDVLQEVAERYPEIAASCTGDQSLPKEFSVSINGEHFAHDDTTIVSAGQSVLILSADAGG